MVRAQVEMFDLPGLVFNLLSQTGLFTKAWKTFHELRVMMNWKFITLQLIPVVQLFHF